MTKTKNLDVWILSPSLRGDESAEPFFPHFNRVEFSNRPDAPEVEDDGIVFPNEDMIFIEEGAIIKFLERISLSMRVASGGNFFEDTLNPLPLINQIRLKQGALTIPIRPFERLFERQLRWLRPDRFRTETREMDYMLVMRILTLMREGRHAGAEFALLFPQSILQEDIS